MPKHYKEMMYELINKMDEDAPANAVAHGGVDMNPTGKKTILTKNKEPMKRLGEKIKENNDNNNVTLKSVLDNIDKIEKLSDQYNKIDNTIVFEEEKEYKTFKEKYNG